MGDEEGLVHHPFPGLESDSSKQKGMGYMGWPPPKVPREQSVVAQERAVCFQFRRVVSAWDTCHTVPRGLEAATV